MNADARRSAMLSALTGSGTPLSATSLASDFGVSRQVIVGDIALLRASGAEIEATPRGYIVRHGAGGLVRTIACRHTGGETRLELEMIVDNGCTVKDVIVEHPLYGQLTGSLELRSRYDVEQFISRSASSDAVPLSALTGGIHLHTLICPDEESFQRVKSRLSLAGFLLSD